MLHFLVAGAGFFVLSNIVGGSANEDQRVITVDRPALLTFLQYRSKKFDQQRMSDVLDAMPHEQRQRLIDDYVREEALYREAQSLELGRNDYIIKRRMIQKLEFITSGFVSATSAFDDTEVKAYFAANKEQYYIEPFVTFTHVFFDVKERSLSEARLLAEAELETLQMQNIEFQDSLKYGDRFLYHVNYVEREKDFVGSHFGRMMADVLFSHQTTLGQWFGPLQSEHGFHLVYIADKRLGRDARFDEVADRVRGDVTQSLLKEKSEKAIQKVLNSYQVNVEIN